jgi:hypothetical protein
VSVAAVTTFVTASHALIGDNDQVSAAELMLLLLPMMTATATSPTLRDDHALSVSLVQLPGSVHRRSRISRIYPYPS